MTCYRSGKSAPKRTLQHRGDKTWKLGGARGGHVMNGRAGGRVRRERLGRGGEATANIVTRMRGRCLAGRKWEEARRPSVVGIRQQLLGSRFCASRMSILRIATAPVPERARCFMDNDDLGQLGSASTLLYTTVSIALTLWAVWDPAVPGGGQWVGSPMALRRPFIADGRTADVVD